MRKSYNRMESIPIDSITSEKELKRAINDWAEGSRPLKNLLWACYENNVKTSGCHSGHGRGLPYIDFDPDGSNREKLVQVLSTAHNFGNSQIFIMFNGNPYSGPDWYKTVIDTFPLIIKDARKFLVELTKAVSSEEKTIDIAIENLLNICDFLKDKDSPLHFRIIVSDEEKYYVYVECCNNNRDWDYYGKLFEKAGMTYDEEKPEFKDWRITWKVVANSKNEFAEVLQRIHQTMMENWDLELPEEITEDMDMKAKALVMRRKFGTNREGIEKLNEWLNANKEKGMRDVHY